MALRLMIMLPDCWVEMSTVVYQVEPHPEMMKHSSHVFVATGQRSRYQALRLRLRLVRHQTRDHMTFPISHRTLPSAACWLQHGYASYLTGSQQYYQKLMCW